MCIYFCGRSCVEDLSSHLINHLSLHPKLRTCSADTILRAISELAQSNISYASDAGKNKTKKIKKKKKKEKNKKKKNFSKKIKKSVFNYFC